MNENIISKHYGISGILDSILKGIEDSGKSLDSLVPDDLAPIDEFHTRGKESTIEIANQDSNGPTETYTVLGIKMDEYRRKNADPLYFKLYKLIYDHMLGMCIREAKGEKE